MIAKFIAAATLAASLIAVSAGAQTAAELLQKGVYTQTAGDADGAIRIYRQAIASPGVTHEVEAEAQAHIVSALLQKGDLAGAGREFGKLAHDYADQEKVVTPMAQKLHSIAESGPGMVLGAFENGKYRHYWTDVEFAVPVGWTFTGQKPSLGGTDRVDLADSSSKSSAAFVAIRRHDTKPADIAARLLARMQDKGTSMRTASHGYVAYRLRPDSVQRRTISGQQAWSAVGDYVDASGNKMIEYQTFVETEKTEVFFSVFAAVPDFAAVQALFEPVIQSARIP